MAPFTSMLKAKKSRKQRPTSPPSPASFYAPRSPTYPTAPWNEPTGQRLRSATQPSVSRAARSQGRDNVAVTAIVDPGIASTDGTEPSYALTSQPYSQQAIPRALTDDDAIQQLNSFTFANPPSEDSRKEDDAQSSARPVDLNRPLPNFKISLNLTGEPTLEDMLVASGMVAEGEALAKGQPLDVQSAPTTRVSRDLPPLPTPRSRSATVPLLDNGPEEASSSRAPKPSSSIRRVPPKPIRIPPFGQSTSGGPKIQVVNDSAKPNPSASSTQPLKLDAGRLPPSNPSTSKTSPQETATTAYTPGSGSALGTGTASKGVTGSSPATTGPPPTSYPASVAASDGRVQQGKRQYTRSSKPQPPLPNSTPYQSPRVQPTPLIIETSSQEAGPSRPPRLGNPHGPNATSTMITPVNPAIANAVSKALARQSTSSAVTTFTTATAMPLFTMDPSRMPVPSPSPALSVSEQSLADLPFTPGFVLPSEKERDTGEKLGRIRADSATLPLDFSGLTPISHNALHSTASSPTTGRPHSKTTSTSPSAYVVSEADQLLERRRMKMARRSASASDVPALILRASRLIDMARSDSLPPDTAGLDGSREDGEILMMLDVRDVKGKGKAIDQDAAEATSPVQEQPAEGQETLPISIPRIVIPSQSDRLTGSPVDIVRSSSPRTPGTASSNGSGSTAHSSPRARATSIASSPSTASTARRTLKAGPVASSTGSRLPSSIGEENDIARLARGMQELSGLATVEEDSISSRSSSRAESRLVTATHSKEGSNISSGPIPGPTTRNEVVRPNAAAFTLAPDVPTLVTEPIVSPTFTKPRPAPSPEPEVVAAVRASPSSFARPLKPGVTPLRVAKSVYVTSPTISASQPGVTLFRRRERSASDASPLSPRQNIQRSASISEIPSPSGPNHPQLTHAPSSFPAVISQAIGGLIRRRSDRSLKENSADKDKTPAEEVERRRGAPPMLLVQNSIRSPRNQFPETPRPFSITSSADHHVAPAPANIQTLAIPVPNRTDSTSPNPLQPPVAPAQSQTLPVVGPSHAQNSAKVAARSATALPIGGPPRKARFAPSPTGPAQSTTPAPGPSPVIPNNTPQQKPPAIPPSIPKFESVPIPWKGLTLDAAKWTFTSKQLQEVVSRAIRQSAEASAIRLLPPEVLDEQIPNETYRLELLREDIKARYKFQVRRRRLLMRSLNLYIDGSDPETASRLTEELLECAESCDRLCQELFQVTDQLAQMSQITQRHKSSALSLALRKLNTSFIRTKGEAIDLQLQLAMLEAERDEAWAVAENVERELDQYKKKFGTIPDSELLLTPASHPPSSWGRSPRTSRVSSARKTSSRASKASLRMSKRSTRSSSSSIRFASIIPPSASSSSGSGTGSSNSGLRPESGVSTASPAPPVPKRARRNSDPDRAHSRPTSVSATTPSSSNRAMIQAQNQLFEMLGIPHEDINKINGSPAETSRQRSYSDPSTPTSPASNYRRRSSLPGTLSFLESPQVIAAMLSLPSNE